MPAAPGTSTFADGLSALLTSLAPLKVLPDADPEVIANLEALIVSAVQGAQAGQMQSQVDAMSGGAGPAGPGMGGNAISLPGPPAGMGPMASAPLPGGMAGPGAGYSPRPSPPNTDELRRILNVG